MKKIYRLRNLDCAACAAKLERSIGKLPEIEAVSVNFFTQRMSLTYADLADAEEVLKKVKRTIAKVEPDCEVVA